MIKEIFKNEETGELTPGSYYNTGWEYKGIIGNDCRETRLFGLCRSSKRSNL